MGCLYCCALQPLACIYLSLLSCQIPMFAARAPNGLQKKIKHFKILITLKDWQLEITGRDVNHRKLHLLKPLLLGFLIILLSIKLRESACINILSSITSTRPSFLVPFPKRFHSFSYIVHLVNRVPAIVDDVPVAGLWNMWEPGNLALWHIFCQAFFPVMHFLRLS